jgi:Family of unknown function (DUF5670)
LLRLSGVGTQAALLFVVAGAVGRGGQDNMLETLIVVLVILWLLGMVSSYTLGGFIHILLVIAIVVLLLRVIQGRRVV